MNGRTDCKYCIARSVHIDNSGQITVVGALNYENTPSYTLTVTASKDGVDVTAQVTINITDVPFSITATDSTI